MSSRTNKNPQKHRPATQNRVGGKYKKPSGSAKSNKTSLGINKGIISLFGFHAVEHALRNIKQDPAKDSGRDIKKIYATESAWASLQRTMSDFDWEQGVVKKLLPPVILDRKDFDRLLPGQVHQGIGLDANPPVEIFLSDLMIAHEVSEHSILLMLDQVTDPHNVGAITRSACVFGVDGIIRQRRYAPAPDGVLAKTACGAVEYTPFVEVTNLSEAIEELKQAGYTAIALDERGEDMKEIFAKTPPPGKAVLVLGAEGKGLRPKVRESCDLLLKIPTGGAIGSLNVSNAAAIALYEISFN